MWLATSRLFEGSRAWLAVRSRLPDLVPPAVLGVRPRADVRPPSPSALGHGIPRREIPSDSEGRGGLTPLCARLVPAYGGDTLPASHTEAALGPPLAAGDGALGCLLPDWLATRCRSLFDGAKPDVMERVSREGMG
ncbi:MAG: hypothetical protein Q8R91_10130 [Candidatus Omnitrophota bacterium]|nr:hypothetical protein [Candidatus Omnitrophota bacterium]